MKVTIAPDPVMLTAKNATKNTALILTSKDFSNAPNLLAHHRSHRDGRINGSTGGRHDADAGVSRHKDRQNERRERRETRADLHGASSSTSRKIRSKASASLV
jgi:hypothetical protein